MGPGKHHSIARETCRKCVKKQVPPDHYDFPQVVDPRTGSTHMLSKQEKRLILGISGETVRDQWRLVGVLATIARNNGHFGLTLRIFRAERPLIPYGYWEVLAEMAVLSYF